MAFPVDHPFPLDGISGPNLPTEANKRRRTVTLLVDNARATTTANGALNIMELGVYGDMYSYSLVVLCECVCMYAYVFSC